MFRGYYVRDGFRYIVLYESTSIFIRFDAYLVRNERRVNIMNTAAAECSYIDDYKDKYRFGDQFIVTDFLELINTSFDTFNTNVVDGKTILEFEKGNVYKTEIHNESGAISKLTITNGKENIDISLVENISMSNMMPINIKDYSRETEAIRLYDNQSGAIHSLQYLLALFPGIKEFTNRDYVIVQNMDDYYSRLDMIQKSDVQFVGIDTETSGLGVNYMENDIMSGIILSNGVGNSTYYPFRQDEFKFNLDEKYIRQILDVVNGLKKEVTTVAHNGTMEMKSFYKDTGKLIRINVDSMMEAMIADPRTLVKHDLKTIEEAIDGFKYLGLSDIFKRRKDINFRGMPEDITFYYALPDGDGTIKAHLKFLNELKPNQEFLRKLESNGQYQKFWNEYFGLRLDMDYLTKYYKKRSNQEKYLEELFHNVVGDRRKISSPQAMRDIMYRKLGCPVKVLTNTFLPATNKTAIRTAVKDGKLSEPNDKLKDIKFEDEVLIKKGELNNKYFPLVIYQKYKEINKDVQGLKRLLDKQVNGRFPFYIKEIGTESERQSGDAQQFDTPKKRAIISDSKHHLFWSNDYKQIEYRVFAMIAREYRLLKYGTDPDADYHRISASFITKDTLDNISASVRKKWKSRNFGIIYGMKGRGLATSLKKGLEPTQEEIDAATNDITTFWTTFTEFNKERQRQEKEIRTKGYAETLFHWIRPDERILQEDTKSSMKSSIVRKLSNTYIQGFAAVILKLAEARVQKWIYDHKWDELVDCDGEMLPKVRLCLSIHDEVLLSSHESIPVEEIMEMFRYAFEMDGLIDTGKYEMKLFAAPALVTNWADGKSDAYEIPIQFRDELIENYKKTHISKINRDNWLELIQEYRNKRIKDWFISIVNKSSNFKELVKNVNHPTLTHMLISLCVSGDDQDKMDHQDVKALAAYKYLLGLGTKDVCEIDENINIKETMIKTYNIELDKEESINEEFGKYSEDEEIEKDETVEYDEYEDDTNVQFVKSENNTTSGKENVKYIKVYTADECIFDQTTKEEDDKIRDICEDVEKDGYMKVYIIKGHSNEFAGYADKEKLDTL